MVAADDSVAVTAIEAVTEKFRRDRNGSIIEVDFRGTEVDNSDLEPLAKLPRLRSVLLLGTAITDDGLPSLAQIATLENLDLRDCKVSNAGLAHLAPLSKLKALKLSGKNGSCSVDDDGMDHVAKLTSLKVLGLDFLWVSELGLEKLTGLRNLEEFYLTETTIGNEAIDLMIHFPNLRRLRVSKTQIDAAGVVALAKLTSLEDLDLSECVQISDDAMKPLSKLSKLKKLNLWRINLSDAGIEPLQGMTSLESLNLDNTRLSDQGMAYLAGLTKLTFLHLGSTQISDTGLVHLEKLKALKELKLTRTAISQKGVDQLKLSLPDANIQLRYVEAK